VCLRVREFTQKESAVVSRWLKGSRNAVEMRRAQILAFSAQGMASKDIAQYLDMNHEYVRQLIRAFNAKGIEALRARARPKGGGKLTEEDKSVIREVATAPPQAFGRPFNQWSLRKLHQFLVVQKKMITPVCYGTIRNAVKRAGLSFQRTRTWKRSEDPAYESKKNASQPSTPTCRKTGR
jgi:transposase